MAGPAGVAGIVNRERGALDPAIHAYDKVFYLQDVDARDKRGHDVSVSEAV
jgi:hypothetical protein